MERPKNVLIALGWYDHRLLQGIAAYATQHRWHLAANSIIHEKIIPWGWEGDGVLAWLAGDDELADFVVSVRKPTVDFSMRRPHLPFARVAQDHDKAGRMVAVHFLERGLRRFLFYSDLDNWSHDERGAGYASVLGEAGYECQTLRWHEAKKRWKGGNEFAHRRQWLLKHLQSAAKPLAVFAANGTLAVEMQELCFEAGIKVPGEVAIVGIEDYLLSVGAANRSVSGVDTHFEEQGYQGAAMLDRLMRGEAIPAEPARIAPARVVTRKSSDLLAVNHPGVARGLQFIAERFAGAVSVEDVARVAGMSRRGLHQAFEEHVGCTPGDRIRSARLDFARRLLSETEEKIESVAQQSGYPNINTFFVAFRKVENQTPAEYRRAARRGR